MKQVRHSIRLPESLDQSLRMLAERHGISVYALPPRAVKAGVAALANATTIIAAMASSALIRLALWRDNPGERPHCLA